MAGLLVGLLSESSDTTSVYVEKTSRITVLTFEIVDGNKGRVIGRRGHTLKAFRSICKSIERSRGRDVIIDVPGYEETES